jgi:hypothetical protein
MLDSLQLKSSGTPEFRVELQHFDGERDLVDHTLAGAMPARKEFEIVHRVMLAVAVFVMDCFILVQLAAKVLLHDVAVFKHFSSFFAAIGECWHRNINVAVAFYVSAKVTGFKFCKGFGALVLSFAFYVAKFLFLIYTAACFSVAVLLFTALKAFEFVSFVSVFSPSDVGARHRAVQRVPAKFLLVCCYVGLEHRERLLAFFAGKADWCATSNVHSPAEMVSSASEATVFSTHSNFAGVAVKRLITIFTSQLYWHRFAPLFGNNEHAFAGRDCQVALQGV